MCGVTIGDNALVVNVGGRAGGVNGSAAVGEAGFDGVAAGLEGCMDASAVCTACVMIAFGSAVGVWGWHALNKTASRMKVRRRGAVRDV